MDFLEKHWLRWSGDFFRIIFIERVGSVGAAGRIF